MKENQLLNLNFQGIPKTERELKAERGKVWSRLFFASLLLSLLFNAIDTGSDILIMIRLADYKSSHGYLAL